jgi:hypothetical protein
MHKKYSNDICEQGRHHKHVGPTFLIIIEMIYFDGIVKWGTSFGNLNAK